MFTRPSPDDPQTLADVEGLVASGFRRLRFGRSLEARYQAQTCQPRRQFSTTVGVGGAIVYNLFLLSDWLTLRDVFGYVAVGRLCLITPMIIGFLLLTQRVRSRLAVEVIAASGTVISSMMPLLVMIYSDSPYRLHYQLGMLLLMVYCSMIQQLPFRIAAAALTSMFVIQLVTTYLAGFMDFVTWQANAFLYLSTVVLLLMASYFLERGSRLSWLFGLRGQLLQARLTEMARTDALTGLFNRRYQGEVLASLWAHAASEPTRITAILLDIDHFKVYNDSYGHLQGDNCLQLLSQAVQQTAQAAGALAFRFGGEEMLVLKAGTAGDEDRQLGEALRAAVARLAVPHPVLADGAVVTVSLGVASAAVPGMSANQLIDAADQALYRAKKAGRDGLCMADTASH